MPVESRSYPDEPEVPSGKKLFTRAEKRKIYVAVTALAVWPVLTLGAAVKDQIDGEEVRLRVAAERTVSMRHDKVTLQELTKAKGTIFEYSNRKTKCQIW